MSEKKDYTRFFKPDDEESGKSKEELWLRKLDDMRTRKDEEGKAMGIEDGIIETIALLNLLGFPTVGSCQGHIDRAFATPWIDFQAPDDPGERYIGESKIKKELSIKYGVNVDDIDWGENKEADEEYHKLTDEAGETEEYKKWNKENYNLRSRLEELINEFYQFNPSGVERITFLRISGTAGRILLGEKNRFTG